MKRDIEKTLQMWKDETQRYPLLIRGARQVGKSFSIRKFGQEAFANLIEINFEQKPQFLSCFESLEPERIVQSLSILCKSEIIPGKTLLFLDEIQSMPKIPSVVKYLIDHYKIKFFLSGSASYYIRNMFTESLAGRKYIFELFPFNFQEFLRAKKISYKLEQRAISQSAYLHYAPYFDEYLQYGGFPAVVLEDNKQEKKNKLDDIFSAYWSLEVERLSDFKKKDRVRNFIFLLMERVGSKADISKLSRELGVAKDTLESYLAFLQDTYLISTIPPYSTNRDVEIRGAKKIHFIDSGLLNQFAQLDRGSVFENAIFNLLRHHGTVQYWQQKDGQEIDFIVDKKIAYEVKLTATEQHLKTLSRRSKKIGIKQYQIVSHKYFDNDKAVYGFML